MSSGTFRKRALDRINSPEQLDHLLTVTTARSWIALTAIAVLMGVAVLWSVFGRISSYVEGEGVFLREGSSIASAATSGNGTLARLLVQKGDFVKSGQVIAQIAAPEVEEQIAGTRALVAEREAELQRQRSTTATEIQANRDALNQRRAALLAVQTNALHRSEALKISLAAQQQLFDSNIVTRSAVQQARADVDQALQEAASTGDQIAQIDIQFRDSVIQGEQRVKNDEFALADAERQLRERLETYRVSSEVLSPVAGIVDEIQLRPGSLVSRGQPVLTIETSGQGLEFVFFAPLDEGEKIQPGQSVRISPNWTIQEEEGTMLGSVTGLSTLPVTPEGLRLLLHNEDLVRHFSGAGPVFTVRVQLKPDPATRSGYAWTSSKGADVSVESGGFGGGEVQVKSQRPISLVIPALRRWTQL
jgi:HlyD family secretion protein